MDTFILWLAAVAPVCNNGEYEITPGYRTLLYNETRLKGHEFHYSRLVEQQNPLPSCAVAYTAKGVETDTPLYHYKNVWAGYTHLYWADPVGNEWFTKFVIDGNT